MNTKKEGGGTAATVIKWTTALGSVVALIVAILGPIGDHFKNELRNTELELERIKTRQTYVLKVLEFDDAEEEIALLGFMEITYDDDQTKAWIKVQKVRLITKIQAEKTNKMQQNKETERKILAAAREKNLTEGQIEQDLTTKEITKIQEQELSLLKTDLLLQAANQLISPKTQTDVTPESCEEDFLKAKIFKPFSDDRSLSDYADVEYAGIVTACLNAQPSFAIEWKAQYLGPKDRIAKRITCTCQGG